MWPITNDISFSTNFRYASVYFQVRLKNAKQLNLFGMFQTGVKNNEWEKRMRFV